MNTDDYARGYVQGHRDGSPAKLKDILLGGSAAIILLSLPIGMVYLLVWLDEHVPAVHAFMGTFNLLAGFGSED